jgi:uncharacterized SAM-binding protein YcdF (DUF218 family)
MYAVIKMLALPPANLLLVMIAGMILRRWWRRTGLAVAIFGALGLYALGTSYVSTRLLVSLESRIPSPAAGPPPGVIVILSAGFVFETADTDTALVDPLTLDRLRRGARLHRRTGLPILVTGGASKRHPVAMGDLMRDALRRDFGVAARWVETRSGSTNQNAVFSTRLLRDAGIRSAYVVTQAWHLPRALAAFEAAGLAAVPAAASHNRPAPAELTSFIPSAKALLRSYYAIHEALGLFWYRRALFTE